MHCAPVVVPVKVGVAHCVKCLISWWLLVESTNILVATSDVYLSAVISGRKTNTWALCEAIINYRKIRNDVLHGCVEFVAVVAGHLNRGLKSALTISLEPGGIATSFFTLSIICYFHCLHFSSRDESIIKINLPNCIKITVVLYSWAIYALFGVLLIHYFCSI